MGVFAIVGPIALLWIAGVVCVIDEYVIKPKKGFFDGLRDFWRETEECEDYWWW